MTEDYLKLDICAIILAPDSIPYLILCTRITFIIFEKLIFRASASPNCLIPFLIDRASHTFFPIEERIHNWTPQTKLPIPMRSRRIMVRAFYTLDTIEYWSCIRTLNTSLWRPYRKLRVELALCTHLSIKVRDIDWTTCANIFCP